MPYSANPSQGNWTLLLNAFNQQFTADIWGDGRTQEAPLILCHSASLRERDAGDLWQLVADKCYWCLRQTLQHSRKRLIYYCATKYFMVFHGFYLKVFP